MRLATIAAAARISGRSRPTIEKWIDKGWLPTTPCYVTNDSQLRQLVDLDDIPTAEETARRVGRPQIKTWSVLVDGKWVPSPTPRAGSREYRALMRWLSANRRLLTHPTDTSGG